MLSPMEKGECLDFMGFVDFTPFFFDGTKKHPEPQTRHNDGWFIDLV